MNVAGFIVIAFMLTVYVLLDGYDLGVAAIAPFIARNDRERAAMMASIGPFWNGNEVWLDRGGRGAVRALSGGVCVVVLGLLPAVHHRAVAADVSRHRAGTARSSAVGAVASVLGCGVFAVERAADRAIRRRARATCCAASRSMPPGTFKAPSRSCSTRTRCSSARSRCARSALHGGAFLALRVEGDLAYRGTRGVLRLWWAVLALYLAVTALTLVVRTPTGASWLLAMPVLSLAALVALRWSAARDARRLRHLPCRRSSSPRC